VGFIELRRRRDILILLVGSGGQPDVAYPRRTVNATDPPATGGAGQDEERQEAGTAEAMLAA
jgi:hypothetical protein